MLSGVTFKFGESKNEVVEKWINIEKVAGIFRPATFFGGLETRHFYRQRLRIASRRCLTIAQANHKTPSAFLYGRAADDAGRAVERQPLWQTP